MSLRKLELLVIVLLSIGLASFSAIHTFEYDLSLGYEIGLRQLQGQVMYKDYYGLGGMPWGALCALFLYLTPTIGWGIILASSTMNAVAAVVMWRIVLELTQERRYAFYAGVVTAFWFLPQIGGASIDHIAYLIGLSGFLVYLSARAFSPNLRYFLTAGLFALAVHIKQSVGAFTFLSFLVSYALLLRKDFFSWFAKMISFYLLSHLLILGLIYCYTDLSQYYEYAISRALNYGAYTKDYLHLLTSLLLPFGIDPLKMVAELGRGRILFYPIVLLFYLSYFTWYRLRVKEKQLESQDLAMGLVFLILSTLWGAALLDNIFTQTVSSVGGILALTLFVWQRKTTKQLEAAAVLLCCAIGLVLVVTHSSIFERNPTASYTNKELYPIRFRTAGHLYLGDDVSKVIEYLNDKPGAISVIDNQVYPVALALRRAPINPTVSWFIPRETDLRREWQLRFISALEQKNARFFISTLGTGSPVEFRNCGGDFIETLEILYSYVRQHFKLVFQSGPIQLYERAEPFPLQVIHKRITPAQGYKE